MPHALRHPRRDSCLEAPVSLTLQSFKRPLMPQLAALLPGRYATPACPTWCSPAAPPFRPWRASISWHGASFASQPAVARGPCLLSPWSTLLAVAWRMAAVAWGRYGRDLGLTLLLLLLLLLGKLPLAPLLPACLPACPGPPWPLACGVTCVSLPPPAAATTKRRHRLLQAGRVAGAGAEGRLQPWNWMWMQTWPQLLTRSAACTSSR